MITSITTNWAAFYQDLLAHVQIPATTREDFGRTQVNIRNLLVNVNDIYAKIRQQGLNPRIIAIYADIATLSNDIEPLIHETGLLLVARRIEVKQKTGILLDYRRSQIGKLVIYAHEIIGNLQAKAITASDHGSQATLFDLSSLNSLGAVVSYRDKAPSMTSLDTFDDSGLELGSPLRLSLTSIFQVATAVNYSHPDITRSMLAWIASATKGSKAALDLYLQSSALLAQLNTANSAVTFVPYLDKDVYSEVANSFLQAAKAYQEQYERFSDRKASLQDRKASANLMREHYQETTQFNQRLIKQAQDNFNAAQQALDRSELSLKAQQREAKIAGIGFKYDAKIWVRDQIIKAVLEMCVALVEFVGSIALLSVGDEAAGAEAGAAVAEGAKAAEEVAKVAETVAEVSEFAQVMTGLTDAMEQLKVVGETLVGLYESISKIVEAAGNIAEATETVEVKIPSTENIAVQAQWDAFRIEAAALLKPAIDADIPGAVEYQVEIEKLAIYGKALMTSQVALIQAGQELARLILQKQVSANQEERLSQYINQLSEKEQIDDELMQLFFERQLNVKRWLFIAIQNYTWAYRYWALRDSRIQFSVVKSVAALQEDLGTVQQEYAEALQSFNPPPQPFSGIALVIPDTDRGQYKDVITNLRQRRQTTFATELNHPTFNGLGRVRLTTIRIWLEGVRTSAEQPLHVDIIASGIYSDRLHGKTFHFSSAPIRRVFKYHGTSILIDGKVDDREQYLYFQPTPFTQWTITVPEQFNFGIDLSTLRALRIELAGSVNASPEMVKPLIPQVEIERK